MKTQKEISFTTAEEALEHYKMGWVAEEHEIMTNSGIDIPKHKAIVRNDNKAVIGIVGKDYQPIQNNVAFAMFDVLCKKHGAKYVKAMEINNGSRTCLQARLLTGEVKKGDIVENRITIFNSFDGSHGFSIFSTPYRLVCLNGMKSAVRAQEIKFNIRHTKNAQNKYEEAFKIFHLAQEDFKDFIVKQKKLAEIMVDKATVLNLIKQTFEVKEEDNYSASTANKMNTVYRLFHEGKGNHGQSLYDFTNGVTEFVDHFSKDNEDRREVYALVGGGAKLKERALESAYQFAGLI